MIVTFLSWIDTENIGIKLTNGNFFTWENLFLIYVRERMACLSREINLMIMSLAQQNRFLNPASGGTFAPTASSWENNKMKIVLSDPSVDG